ncbi:hypothetical protein ACIOHS_02570 [Streptomyces sp. NPDC088253]|uniref:hypothetical protein n=1 Tax=Streptomyces sp. NPDC088253 TaxID=3365846 RepID=UPI003826D91B
MPGPAARDHRPRIGTRGAQHGVRLDEVERALARLDPADGQDLPAEAGAPDGAGRLGVGPAGHVDVRPLAVGHRVQDRRPHLVGVAGDALKAAELALIGRAAGLRPATGRRRPRGRAPGPT